VLTIEFNINLIEDSWVFLLLEVDFSLFNSL
jgi:hypothetical protein